MMHTGGHDAELIGRHPRRQDGHGSEHEAKERGNALAERLSHLAGATHTKHQSQNGSLPLPFPQPRLPKARRTWKWLLSRKRPLGGRRCWSPVSVRQSMAHDDASESFRMSWPAGLVGTHHARECGTGARLLLNVSRACGHGTLVGTRECAVAILSRWCCSPLRVGRSGHRGGSTTQ